jgi:hypothetical protein
MWMNIAITHCRACLHGVQSGTLFYVTQAIVRYKLVTSLISIIIRSDVSCKSQTLPHTILSGRYVFNLLLFTLLSGQWQGHNWCLKVRLFAHGACFCFCHETFNPIQQSVNYRPPSVLLKCFFNLSKYHFYAIFFIYYNEQRLFL